MLTISAALTVLAVGCQHAPPPTPEGTASFQILRPTPPPSPEGNWSAAAPVPREVFVEAEPIEPLVLPIYPPQALEAGVPWASVSVSLTVDSHGRVVRVKPSLIGFTTTPSRFTADFYAAVEEAVRRWRFNPAQRWYVEPSQNNGRTYPTVTRTENLETTIDIAFAFTPSGVVLPPGVSTRK